MIGPAGFGDFIDPTLVRQRRWPMSGFCISSRRQRNIQFFGLRHLHILLLVLTTVTTRGLMWDHLRILHEPLVRFASMQRQVAKTTGSDVPGGLPEYFFDILFEAHIEHLVGFIQYQHADPIQPNRTSPR
jgi:hypothetical protein